MRVFHVKVFDDIIEGTGTLYSATEHDGLLALADKFNIVAITSNVSGTSPTLTVHHEESPDGSRWTAPGGTPEINAQALTAGTVQFIGGTPVAPASGFARLKISLGGTSPKARITIWCTGRDAPGTA